MGGKCHNPHFTDEETSSLTICELTASKWQRPRSSVDPRLRVRREMKISEDLKDYQSLLVISPFRESLSVLFDIFFTDKLAELKQNSIISKQEEYFPVLFYFYLHIASHTLHIFHKPHVCMYFVMILVEQYIWI